MRDRRRWDHVFRSLGSASKRSRHTPGAVRFRKLGGVLRATAHGVCLLLCGTRRARSLARAILAAALLPWLASATSADGVDDAQALYHAGNYAECISAAEAGIESEIWRETWWRLKIRAELQTGQYTVALESLQKALEAFPTSIHLRLISHTVQRMNDLPEEARAGLEETEALALSQRWRYNDSASRITLGRIFLLRGADAREVLRTFYDPVKKSRPTYVETYLAVGDLALAKHDHALAAESFTHAAKLDPENPDVHFGLARAFATDDPPRAAQALARTLELNPRYADALLMRVDRLIDSENHQLAEETLQRVLAVNAKHPRALAYRAVLAHLEGDAEAEQSLRAAALGPWSTNPEVDHLIGRKLSQKYRFTEGAAYQRKALAFDPDYLVAKLQLSRDLLRLGLEEEGWRLANEVYEADHYNVAAHNLVTLGEEVAKFKTLQADGLVVRMEAREADVYGHDVLALIQQANDVLTAKYDVRFDQPIVIEIFPHQQDFAVRTFGIPFVDGFLGVCFGRVITANSPASQGAQPANWKALLWHEFCHSVTLHKTNNKMPRWLSEGISVYEERQRDPAWGQSMNAGYRRIVLAGGMTPIAQLSGAFLDPPTPLHLDFAYYQSSLVVEHLVQTHGHDTLLKILDELAAGAPINTVLASHVGPLEEFDRGFVEFAKKKALAFAPNADWDAPQPPPDADTAALADWNRQHPNSIAGLLLWARQLVDARQWAAAKEPLEKLLEIYPEGAGPEGPYLLLSTVYRELGETEAERAVLERLAVLDSDALDVYLRLMGLCEEKEDWVELANNAERVLAVNPLLRASYRQLARAAEELNDPARAICAYRALLQMDPIDPVEAHFRLARLFHADGQATSARRHVLMALEDAPRYRAAQQLLLEIVDRPDEAEEPDESEEPDKPDEPSEPESAQAPQEEDP